MIRVENGKVQDVVAKWFLLKLSQSQTLLEQFFVKGR
jgi:hypothetical protein